ncbi:hypothetical protein PAL_GLEAN10002460 [Pteropus alecto]|uniref:Uncharacterized protein n=1 Tax=Pteropus alecto TaxID=9402 RepID=L5L3Q9_PTEAL|nr:hypothetical protein PAL_GLEAN10002460 [Pteropus alecto]
MRVNSIPTSATSSNQPALSFFPDASILKLWGFAGFWDKPMKSERVAHFSSVINAVFRHSHIHFIHLGHMCSLTTWKCFSFHRNVTYQTSITDTQGRNESTECSPGPDELPGGGDTGTLGPESL